MSFSRKNFSFPRHALWLAIAGFALPISPLHAQLANWSVVSANNTIIPTAGFPSTVAPSFFRYGVGDVGQGLIVGESSTGGTLAGRYARINGVFTQYVQLDVSGLKGPGRSGAEAGHVFRVITTGDHDIGANGQVVFSGRAGAPGSVTSTLPVAVWRWNTQANIEIARNLTDGALGPNLGPGWFFDSTPLLRSLPNGNVIIDADLISPTSANRDAVILHVAGVGNTPCVLQGSTDLSLSPNLGDNSTFALAGAGFRPVALASKVYLTAATTASTGGRGIWEICNGAPRAIAATDRSTALGPSYGVSTAYFSNLFTNVRPGASGDLVFEGQFRDANVVSQPFFNGIFRHRSGVNQRLAYTGTTGTQGPNWLGSTFSTLNAASLTSAGRHIAFEGDARTPDNTTVGGIWRIRPDGNPEPVALEGILGQFGPAPGQTFARFDQWTLFANGDVIANCAVNGGSNGLYRFAIGRAPETIIRVGQTIPVQTTTGIVQATVNSFQITVPENDSGNSSYNWSGIDSWTGTDASVLLSASINVGGTNVGVLLLSQVADLEVYLKTGFE